MERRVSTYQPSSKPDRMNQGDLAERLELLEARIRMQGAPPPQEHRHQYQPQYYHAAIDDSSTLSALESPAISQHSFHFDEPSNCSVKDIEAKNSTLLSPQTTTTNLSNPSSTGRVSRLLEAVNRAAEQHMQKVAAMENSRCDMSVGGPSGTSSSSFQTLKTSHAITSCKVNRVVKESPPMTTNNARNRSSSCPRILQVDTSFPANKTHANNPMAKQTKRKSTPVKKEITTSKNDGTRRKRTRLQFSGNSNDGQQPKLLSVGNNSNSRSPRHQKAVVKNRRINDFFTKKGEKEPISEELEHLPATTEARPAVETTPTKSSLKVIETPESEGAPTPLTQIAQLQEACRNWEQMYQEKDAQLKAVTNNRTILQTAVQSALKQRESELAKIKSSYTSFSENVNSVLEDLMRQQALREAQHLREQLAADGNRLGRIVYNRAGMRTVEAWEEGTASRLLQDQREKLLMVRSKLEERQRKAALAAQVVLHAPDDKENEATKTTSQVDLEVEGITIKTPLDALEAVESVRLHLKAIQGKLEEITRQENLLKEEKVEHIRSWKRLANEDSSQFRHRPKLHNRYVLMTLLGKGGFSEVWKAYDVEDLQEVAVKIHQLDPRWSDEKKESYTKHVSREYEIHRNVRHPRIVSLLDVFEVDTNSFCTVLEHCSGTDLETMLKRRTKLAERDARAILLQILSGMKYLSHPSPDGKRQAIIHYDLKPANILFSAHGDAKITDFGLSKIVETHDPGQSMELTSQGAGTYWYLPPECFIMDDDVTVKISNKVDVWSIGVIYYQMLYGKRPFGHGQSQDRILTDNTMLNAKVVVFPEEPTVSVAGKAFIRDCLQYDQSLRPTVAQICENPYVTSLSLASSS